MTITVKFFASLREQVGKTETQIEFSDSLTVNKIWQQVTANKVLPKHILVAVNQEYASQDTTVKEGDEIAFFPPVTGG